MKKRCRAAQLVFVIGSLSNCSSVYSFSSSPFVLTLHQRMTLAQRQTCLQSQQQSRNQQLQPCQCCGVRRRRAAPECNFLMFEPSSSSPFRSTSLSKKSWAPVGRRRTELYHDASAFAALGNDALVFLAATTVVIPLVKRINISPVLGFLAAGVLLGPSGLGLFTDLGDLNALGELGITFLLFEQGLELSSTRLKALSRYAFGLGTLQVVVTTFLFTLFPFIGGVEFLEVLFKSPESLVGIKRWDEAFVIGAALSLSSSAFVLKILQEKGQRGTVVGSATLGVLLLQDIAVVPVLVLLPIIESQGTGGDVDTLAQATFLGLIALKAVVGLGAILFFGRVLLRRLFELVAGARNSETFVSVCLLVALGMGELTDKLGLSTTLGAFVAGTLLAETNYRTQVEADIAPFRGLLLGLFFVTTGTSLDLRFLSTQWPTVIALLIGLVLIKGVVTAWAARLFQLTPGQSVRVGSYISGGGEFAFVVLTLAERLKVLPPALNKTLVGVVVLSMALTPLFGDIGDRIAQYLDDRYSGTDISALESVGGEHSMNDMVVICGFGPIGQITASLISSPVVSSELGGCKYVAFDLNPKRVKESRAKGYPVLYGDGCMPQVLHTAGIDNPKAILVTYSSSERTLEAVKRLREAFPSAPIFARAPDYEQYWKLMDAGANAVVSDLSESSVRMGTLLLEAFNVGRSDEVQSAKVQLRETLADVARVGGVKGEFSAKYEPSRLRPEGIVSRKDVKEIEILSGTTGKTRDIALEDLGVKVCLLPAPKVEEGLQSQDGAPTNQEGGGVEGGGGTGSGSVIVVETYGTSK